MWAFREPATVVEVDGLQIRIKYADGVGQWVNQRDLKDRFNELGSDK